MQTLNGTWRLGSVPPQPFEYPGDDRHLVGEWLPITLPGGIHQALMAAGRLPDLTRWENLPQAEWVNQCDWWLERDVELRRSAEERLFIHLDALDYAASLWLNDTHLGHHEGAFSKWTVEITPWLTPDPPQTVRIALRLTGAHGWPTPEWEWRDRLLIRPLRRLHPGKFGIQPYHPRYRLLRPPMQAGWDFAPALPALGLWEGAELETTGPVQIRHLALEGWQIGLDNARATLTLDTDTLVGEAYEAEIRWQPLNFDGAGGTEQRRFHIGAGQRRLQVPLMIPHPKLWSPWEQGEQNLYTLTVQIADTHRQIRFGIRTVSFQNHRLRVNGKLLFARGVNWVPLDSLGATSDGDSDRYRTLLLLAKEQNVNLLRVWGGGGRERRIFYELCDELGIVLWQEFPFACAFLDHYPQDAAFLNHAEQESRAMVRAIQQYPSVALWCAGNEFSMKRNAALVGRLGNVVTQEDDGPFLPPSPTGADQHQWHVWHGKAPLHILDEQDALFLSEIGMQALPAHATLEQAVGPDNLWPPSPAWEGALVELPKLFTYAGRKETLAEQIAESQAVQAAGLQVAVERMRRRKAEGAGGIALWQWNDAYPAISWALVDYYGRPKVAALRLKEWYNPICLSLAFDRRRGYRAGDTFDLTVWAINDLDTQFGDCEARLTQGEALLAKIPLTIAPTSAAAIKTITVRLPSDAPLELALWQGDERLAHNQYPLILPPPHRRPWFGWLYRSVANWIMEG